MRLEIIKSHDVVYQLKYPEGYDIVLRGDGYWYPPAISLQGVYGGFCDTLYGDRYDTRKHKCYNCDGFINEHLWGTQDSWLCNSCSA